MTKRKICCLCLAVLLLLPMVVTGCAPKVQSTIAPFDENYGAERYSYFDGAIAENDNYQLWWDDGRQCAILWDLNTGLFHSTTPYDFYSAGDSDNYYAASQLNSPLSITYIDSAKSNPYDVTVVDGCFEYDAITSRPIENGVSVTYSFPNIRIAVTVEYVLNNNGLQIRIPLDGLQEDENRIYEIAVAPFLVSAINDNDAYLMVPSGGGALIDAKSLNQPTVYSEAVYGEDPSEPLTIVKRREQKVTLPVFGAKNGDTGMLAIIESGKESARINAKAGDAGIGYSNVYASFRLRGREEVLYSNMSNNQMSSARYGNSVSDAEYLSVQYIPLQEDNTYMGMANRYRSYLQEQGFLTATVEETPALSVSFLGSTRVHRSFFGLPYRSDCVTTSVVRTQEIAGELQALVPDGKMLVSLLGYGEGGLSSNTLAGGFTNSTKVGSKKEWSQLQAFAAENDMVLAMDYDLIYFREDSKGYRANDVAARSLSSLKMKERTYVLNTAVENSYGDFWYYLGRGKLAEAMNKAIAAAKKWNFGAVSFSSLSQTAYGDYCDVRYTEKSHMAEDVQAMLQNCTDNGLTVVATRANDYAALYADYVVETPIYSSKFSSLDAEIPFYNLVFQGYKALTSPSINTAINVNDAYLQAVATGMTLQFTLCDTLHKDIQSEQDTAYISSRYSDWKETIADMVERSNELHEQVGNQPITQYVKAEGMSYTCFENGVEVYVNYTDTEMDSPLGTIPAHDFVYG